MNRKDITTKISSLVEKELLSTWDSRVYWAKEVTFDYGTIHPIRVDYIKVKPLNNSISGIEKSDVYCYEVKSSLEDYKSKHGHNFFGDFNYYIMPYSVYAQISNELKWSSTGVYVVDDEWLETGVSSNTSIFCDRPIHCISKGRRKNRDYPLTTVLLMMFRSRHRDVFKLEKELEKCEN